MFYIKFLGYYGSWESVAPTTFFRAEAGAKEVLEITYISSGAKSLVVIKSVNLLNRDFTTLIAQPTSMLFSLYVGTPVRRN